MGTGFGLQLAVEQGSGIAIDPACKYRYVPGVGPVRVKADTAVGHEPDSARLVSGGALLALQSGQIEACHLHELKILMRSVLQYHFGGKPMVSQTLFR